VTTPPHDGVTVVKPGHTYVGKQGFTYAAGASAETIGAQRICMNLLPMPPGGVAKAHYHKGIETIAIRVRCCLRQTISSYRCRPLTGWRSAYGMCDSACATTAAGTKADNGPLPSDPYHEPQGRSL